MGILDHALEVYDVPQPSHQKLKKRKQLHVVEIKIKMDCKGCEPNLLDPKQSKLMVTG